MSAGDVEPLFPSMPVPSPQPRREERTELVLHRSMAAEPWMDEALYQARAGRRTAWLFAFLLLVIVGAQAAAIAIMLPLKQVVPYTVTVDRQTGYVETARGVNLGDLNEDEAVVQSMLAQYVLARETFDPADFNDRYGRVALWSLGPARDEYVAQYQNGQAMADLRPGSTVRVTVKKIELLTRETARVRFSAALSNLGSEPVSTDYAAIVTFRFTGAPMKMEDRFLNPLGFQATAYRRDQEAIPPETPAAPASPAPLSPSELMVQSAEQGAATPQAQQSPAPPTAPAQSPSPSP
jgi:type IV secretion system protein VirB8